MSSFITPSSGELFLSSSWSLLLCLDSDSWSSTAPCAGLVNEMYKDNQIRLNVEEAMWRDVTKRAEKWPVIG